MPGKKPVLLLVIGLLCAVMAVFWAARFMSKSGGAGEQKPQAQILVATESIQFGTPLVLKEGKTAGNVAFIPWPKDYVLHAAFTKKKELEDKKLLAFAPFVRHEPVLKSEVIAEEEFIPEGYYAESLAVSRDKIESGLLEPGMKVDVLRSVKGKGVQEFMRCATIYAIGGLNYKERDPEKRKKLEKEWQKDKKKSSQVWVLVRKEDWVEFTEGKSRTSGRFFLLRAKDPSMEGPVLVRQKTSQDPTAVETRTLLDVGNKQLAAGNRKTALALFMSVLEKLDESDPLVQQAAAQLKKCQAALAGELYEQAEETLRAGNAAGALALADAIEKSYPDAAKVVAALAELRSKAKQLQGARQVADAYRKLLSGLEEKVRSGDLREAEDLLARLQEDFKDYTPPEGERSPQEAHEKFGDALSKRRTEFARLERLFKYHLGEGSKKEALEKFEEMKKDFPEHHFIDEAKKSLEEKGFTE